MTGAKFERYQIPSAKACAEIRLYSIQIVIYKGNDRDCSFHGL